ncbi:sialate O-acetylesterase-like [Oscarella lobularis]|uniref:sialate O-acetylesterase-like n=1 Tax=Oscarella lobularis TaxID=121494 RepID=UPI003313AEF0
MERKVVGVLLCYSSLFLCASASIRFSNVFGSNMVLQREPQKAVVWGYSSPHDEVTVTCGNFRDSVMADNQGEFSIALPATHPGGPYTIVAESKNGGDKAMLENVLFGDVFLCGGQSNMQFTVDSAFNASMEIAAANKYSDIRVMTVGEGTQSATPLSELGSIAQNWSVASEAAIGHGNWSYFSAVCWFFGRDLYDTYHIPIGLISDNWGGTPVQSWSGPDALAKCNQTLREATEIVEVPGAEISLGRNSNLWNAMIVPFLNMRLIGAIWYQGEANVGMGPQHGETYYACQFSAMIQDWREKFNLENMYFGFVQLAPWKSSGSTLVAELRTGQEAALKLPIVGMATAVDHGDLTSPFGSVHPRAKQPVGLRLSATARALLYKEKLVYQGPMISNAHANGNQVVVNFDPSTLGSGLEMKPAACPQGLPPQYCMEFELQTSDQKWHAAQGTIQGNTVVVSMSENVTCVASAAVSVITVRYGYADWPLCTIFNKEGYPAIPFSYSIHG